LAETLSARSTGARSVVAASERATVIVIGLVVAAAALRFWRIGHQSFWYDEAFTVVLVHRSPSAMFALLPKTELTPPLYYSIAWVWVRIFGYGEAGLRSLSALAGVATVPAMYGAGKELISRRAGLIAAALVAFNPLLIWYSQEARSYSVLVLFATLSLLAFAHLRSPRPTPRWLVAWVLVASLALATHYYAALAVVPEAVWLLWVHRRDRRVLVAVFVVAAVGLALLPIAFSQRPHASWIAWWPLNDRLSQLTPQFLLGTGAPARTVLKLAGAAAVLLAAALLARRADASERRGALVAGVLAAAGFALSLLLILAGVDELITRNVIVVLIPLIVLVAGGLGARRAGVLGLVGAGTLCTIGLVAAIGVAVDQHFQRPDWRGVARALGPGLPTGAGRAILIQNYPGILPLQLYMPGLRFIKNRGARVDEVDVIAASAGLPNAWFCWWGSACNLSPSALDTAIRLRGFHPVGPVLHVSQFQILRLRSTAPIRLTPGKVSRALTTTALPFDGLLYQRPA
jgi:mannosyltransferase